MKTRIKPIKLIIVLLILLIIVMISRNILSNGVYASSINIDQLTQEKIESIKNTENTDLKDRNGNTFYVSTDGDDSNDGLTEETAWKTLSKINDAFNNKTISNGDTILLKRGDIFRGNINVTAYDILIGAYGDETQAKPEILVSPYNGALEGNWEEVQNNIWRYTVDGQDPFKNDVGVIWCFSNSNDLNNKMPNINGSFEYAQKIINNQNIDDSQIDLTQILKNDLEFFQFGHPSARSSSGGALYLYSTSNPKDRFDRIEFSLSKNAIRFSSYTNLHVDNITIKFAGNHGIGGATVANLKVTNCELGFIGGAMQYYKDDGSPVRFGNAIEIYGSVTDTNGYEVEDGFVVYNNYIYQVYDAGITFQLTTENSSKVEKVLFSNNVVEYCNYNVEYWNTSTSLSEEVQENTYINNYTISDNIMRYAGYGICSTRTDKGRSCCIKTWEHNSTNDNRVIGEFKIINNIFDSPLEQMIYISTTNKKYLPKFKNNQFYSSKDVPFGYYYIAPKKINYPFSKQKLDKYFPRNEFIYLEEGFEDEVFTGTSKDTNWELNIKNGILTISGVGQMADYTEDNLPEWYEYKTFVNKIVIGKDVTKLGKYAFYKLPYVEELEIDAVNLENLSRVGNNDGDNFTFYQTGKEWIGINVTFGEDVIKVPSQIFWPAVNTNEAPNIANVEYKGNKITEIGDHAFLNLHAKKIAVPSRVEKIGTLAFSGAEAKIIYIPESVNQFGSWIFNSCKYVEKIALSPNITKIGVYTFNKTNNLKVLVIPGDVTYNGSNYTGLFSTESDTTVYGNETVRQLVEDYSTATGTSNIKYADLSEYPNLLNEIYEEAIADDKSQESLIGEYNGCTIKTELVSELGNVLYVISNGNSLNTSISVENIVDFFEENEIDVIEIINIEDNEIELTSKELIGTNYKIITDRGEYTTVVYGDISGDGLVNATDVSQIIRDFLGIEIIEQEEKRIAGDVFKDGKLDSIDISIMIKSFLGTLEGSILKSN